MPRKATDAPPAEPYARLPTDAMFTMSQARKALGLATYTLVREVRAGRLRTSRRAPQRYTTGAWLMEWVQGGEDKRDGKRKTSPQRQADPLTRTKSAAAKLTAVAGGTGGKLCSTASVTPSPMPPCTLFHQLGVDVTLLPYYN
jgi:hypothetical protein